MKKFMDDAERIFSNAAYEAVIGIVNDGFDGKAVEMVAEKAKSIIGELSPYSVFRRKDAWDHADSEGLQGPAKAIREKPLRWRSGSGRSSPPSTRTTCARS